MSITCRAARSRAAVKEILIVSWNSFTIGFLLYTHTHTQIVPVEQTEQVEEGAQLRAPRLLEHERQNKAGAVALAPAKLASIVAFVAEAGASRYPAVVFLHPLAYRRTTP